MDILKLSQEWVRAELFSAKIVWIFSLLTLITAVAFYYLSRTVVAKAFVIPLLVCAILLAAIGSGLYFANKPRIKNFQTEYNTNPKTFIQKELERTAKSENDFKIVFRVLPAIIIMASIVLLLISSPNWRAASISIIILIAFLMLLDSNTSARNNIYQQQLLQYQK